MAARATGQARTAHVTPGRVLPGGRAPVIPVRPGVNAAGAMSTWARRANIAGRAGVWAIPILAVLALLGLRSTNAFATDAASYSAFLATRWSSPMAIAVTTATVVFALVALVGLTLLLFGGRAKALALAGLIPGAAGAIMMLIAVGSVIVQAQGAASPVLHGNWNDFVATAHARGTVAAVLVVGGAVLLTIGWIVLGLAVMCTSGLNQGDGALLVISAPLIYLGGFVLHILPALGAFLLGAAGIGIVFASGRVAIEGAPSPGRVRTPRATAAAPSAFARFADGDLADVPAAAASVGTVESPSTGPAEPVRIHTAPTRGAYTGSAHQPHGIQTTPAPDAKRTKVRPSLAQLSRGISTAWQVNRASRSANGKAAAPGGAPMDSAKAAPDGWPTATSNGRPGHPTATAHGIQSDAVPGTGDAPAKPGFDAPAASASIMYANGGRSGPPAGSGGVKQNPAQDVLSSARNAMKDFVNGPVKSRWNGLFNSSARSGADPSTAPRPKNGAAAGGAAGGGAAGGGAAATDTASAPATPASAVKRTPTMGAGAGTGKSANAKPATPPAAGSRRQTTGRNGGPASPDSEGGRGAASARE